MAPLLRAPLTFPFLLTTRPACRLYALWPGTIYTPHAPAPAGALPLPTASHSQLAPRLVRCCTPMPVQRSTALPARSTGCKALTIVIKLILVPGMILMRQSAFECCLLNAVGLQLCDAHALSSKVWFLAASTTTCPHMLHPDPHCAYLKGHVLIPMQPSCHQACHIAGHSGLRAMEQH